jgi:hypothetical protein
VQGDRGTIWLLVSGVPERIEYSLESNKRCCATTLASA